ncbi:MAG: hypothetical protein ACI8PZ_001252 [Myxococcota bacterium]|jgi:hypothetical protein
MLLGLALGGPALAADPTCGAEFYDVNWLVAGMNKADGHITALKLDDAAMVLNQVQKALPCTADVIHPNHLARFGRLRAIAAFFDQDEMDMAYWGRLALKAPSVPWPEAFGPEHAVRDAFTFIEPAGSVEVPDKQLAPPKGGGVMLDGELLRRPRAGLEMAHFLQVLDKSGIVVESVWVDGVAFPERLLEPGGAATEIPKWYTAPASDLDATAVVNLSAAEMARRDKAIRKAEEKAYYEERRQQKVLEREQQRSEARLAKLEKQREKDGLEPSPEVVAETVTPRKAAAPTDWVGLSFDHDRDAVGSVGLGDAATGCDDLIALEPFALMGKLKPQTVQCLEASMRLAARQTRKDAISRVLMADAYARDDQHRWEGSVRRHLEEIDRSDADLCYIFARHLAQKGDDFLAEAIRYANLALENSLQWEGQLRVDRMYQLHRINALGAQKLWYDAEQANVEAPSRQVRLRAGFWRNQTKNLAREWLSFSLEAGLDPDAPFELCVQAAGTQQYCEAG